ncbi:hypothetical protein GF374_01530 [Candidatus Woesearchaeota archaeon]|nr:hypothetical protein [Candidatus Woesearchaeota archaeon]
MIYRIRRYKMKPIKPSAKERKRYILIKLKSKKRVEKKDVKKLVIQAGLQFLGELGMARSGLQFLPETWNKKNMTGIIKTGHKFVNETKAALALIQEVKGEKAAVQTIKTSGSIKTLKNIQKKVK